MMSFEPGQHFDYERAEREQSPSPEFVPKNVDQLYEAMKEAAAAIAYLESEAVI